MMLEKEQAAQLSRTRTLATGLLVLMAILFVVAKIFQPHYPYLAYLGAFAEAAMVGALADWFAVTALFRSPLGLPIPHTAIIPRNKDRIGESLSDFLEHNFITQEIIQEELNKIDFARGAAAWLSTPENSQMVSRQIVGNLPTLLRFIEDEDVRQFLHQRIASAFAELKFGPALAEVLALLVAGQHHQALFDHLIEVGARALERNKPYIRWKIHENSPRWLPKVVDDRFYERLIDVVQSTLDEMRDDDSEWRMRFQEMVDDLAEQLRTSPEYEEKIGSVIGDVLANPRFRTYTIEIWHSFKARLEKEALSENSPLAEKLNGLLSSSGNELLRDEALQLKLNRWIRNFATEAVVTRREVIADMVARVIQKWDAETMSRKLELHVGKDLQYIRINGTLVGGMVGLVLYVISLAF